MRNIKDNRFIVTYSDSGKHIKFTKQFNSLFHLNNYRDKMKASGYKDIEVSEKKNNLGKFKISFIKAGKDSSIVKQFSSEKAKNCYIEAMKRDGCRIKSCKIEEKVVSYSKSNTFKFIPVKSIDETYYFTRTNKKSRY